jgi:hypothetical protein
MADISRLLEMSSGSAQSVDLSANNLLVGGLKVGGTLLSDILGATLVGDQNTYVKFTPTSATIKGSFAGIDAALFNYQVTGSYITSLTSDVTASGPGAAAATVNSVGGVSAANVASGANLANAATNLNTASAIVKRDSNGDIVIGGITANRVSNISFIGDQEKRTTDLSIFRTGSMSVLASGTVFTLIGQPIMFYMSHNTPIDGTTGDFLGRDDTDACQFYVWLEDGSWRRYDAVSNTAGTVPVFTLSLSEDSTGFSGIIATAVQPNITSIGAQSVDLNMNSHKIVNVSNGTNTNDAVNYAQLSAIAVGILPLNPVDVPNMVADNISTPPGSPTTGDAYIVGITGTGNWASKDGHIMEWSGTAWVDVLSRAVIAGDRVGIVFETGSGASGGFAGKDKNIAQIVSPTVGSYTYTFTVPTATNTTAINGASSRDAGHTYYFNGTSWVEFTTGSAPIAGSALAQSGQVFNVQVDGTSISVSGINQLQVIGVGGSTAANVNAAELLANAATDSNVASSIVKRTAGGNFTAGTITAALTGVASGNELPLTFSAPLSRSVNTISIPVATGSTNGYLSSTDWNTFNSKGSGNGTVTAISVSSSNGFTGSSSGGATPALTLATSVSGVLKGNGTAISAAIASDITTALAYTPLNRAGDTLSGLVTDSKVGDQFNLSGDASPYRTGSWALTASGALYTLLGEFAMQYWTHNTEVDGSGNFLGRGDTGTCTLWAFTEAGLIKIYNAVSAAATTVPTWTLVSTQDTATGSITLASGNVTLTSGTFSGAGAGFSENAQFSLFAGTNAGISYTTAQYNVAIGDGAQQRMLGTLATATNNISFGANALKGSVTVSANTGTDNFAAGNNALTATTSGARNFAVGSSSLAANTSGADNIGIGSFSLLVTTSGTENIALGNAALRYNLSGYGNIGIGYHAGMNMQPATGTGNNVAIGYGAMTASGTPANNTGTENIAIGDTSLFNLTSGTYNIALGTNSLQYLTTGSSNISLGRDAGGGATMLAVSNGIFIGQSAGPTTNSITNAIAIGQNANVAASNSVVFGASGTPISVGINMTTPTSRLHLPAGTATAGQAPLKLTSGTNLGTIEAGALEFDGTHLYFSISATRYQIDQQVTPLPSVYDAIVTVVASGAGANQINGPTQGPVTLPSAMTYVGSELQVYLNGQLLYLTADWTATSGTTVTFVDTLQVGDIINFIKLRNN